MMILQNESFDNMESARERQGPASRAVTPLPGGRAVTPTRRRPVTPITSRSVVGGEQSTPRSPSQISARPVTPATNHRGIPPPYTPPGQPPRTASSNRLTVDSARAVSRQQVAPLMTATVVNETNQKPTYNETEKAKFVQKAEEMRAEERKKALLQNALKEARERREKERSNLSSVDVSRGQSRQGCPNQMDPHHGPKGDTRPEKRTDPRERRPGTRHADPSGRRSRAEDYDRLIPPELQFEPAKTMEGAEANIKAIEEIVRAKRILMRQKRKKERVKQHQILSEDQE